MRRFVFAFAIFAALAASTFPAQAVPRSRVATGIIPQTTNVFRSLGLLKKSSFYRTLAVSPTKTVRSLALKQSAAADETGGDLSLSFNLHYKDNNERKLQENRRDKVLLPFFRAYYRRMTALFGQPAPEQQGKTITVELLGENDEGGAIYQPLLKPDATDGGSIFFRYVDYELASSKLSELINNYNFTRLLFLAFQGPNLPSYNYANGDYVESYAYGMADAAALLVAYGADGSRADFDPTSLDAYVLPVYDLFNHPELGNAYIYARSGDSHVVSDFRVSMAQSAWLKVAIERPSFFADYNKASYKQIPARSTVKPEQLRALAAQICPKVEGLGFQDWVRRQYVLDTSVTTGQKLYAVTVPLPLLASGDRRAGFIGYAEAFTTDSDGDENISMGYGSITAFDETGANINAASSELSASNLLNFYPNSSGGGTVPGTVFDPGTADDKPAGQANFGAGFTDIGTPDRSRITLRLRFKSAETTAVFPYIGPSASGASTLNYFGVTSNGDAGSLTLSSNTGVSEKLTVARGAFVSTNTVPSGAQIITSMVLGGRTFVRNTAWISQGATARGLAFVLDGAGTSDSFTLKTASGASQVRMISLPCFPLESDESKILGISTAQLKLARYRPNLAPGTLQNGVVQFGITGDRHELYPNISAPMAPGRGYWLGVSDYTHVIQGSEPPRNRPYEVPILGGWNQIGVPFNRAFAPSALKVRYGGFSPVPLATAVSNGWVRPGIWRWLARGGYDRVDDDTPVNLQPFEGYYLYAVPARGVSLVFDINASSDPDMAAQALTWRVSLMASTNATSDRSNRFGVGSMVAAAKPPAGATAVTLRFLSSGDAGDDAGGAGAASGWADSFLRSLERTGEWKFRVEGTTKNQRVALAWGDLKALPPDVKLSLTDEKIARVQALTAQGSYKWTSDGTPRALTISATRIALSNLSVRDAASKGVEMTLTLNIAAPGRLEIRNASGDTLALLKSGTFKAGAQKFSWSGEQTNGKTASSGTYRAVWTPQLVGDKGTSRTFTLR